MKRSLVLAAAALIASAAQAFALTPSGPIVISGQNGTVISGLRITSTSGPCVQIINSTNITIKGSDIGPCGTNNSTSDSRGVYISGSTGVNLYDNYIHVENLASGCCDTHDNVHVLSSTSVNIKGNVIAYGETNVAVISSAASDQICIFGNFLLNPRGPFPRGQNVQVYGSDSSHLNTNITVSSNYTLSSTDTAKYLFAAVQEDSVSFGFSGPSNTVDANYLSGGTSNSGCGVTFDTGVTGGSITNNIAPQYNCGVQVTSGQNVTLTGNKVLSLSGGVNGAGVIAATFGSGNVCSTLTISNNISFAQAGAGTPNNGGYYTDAGCTGITLSGNTFDPGYGGCTPGVDCAAYAALYPMDTTNPPPLIPPQPYSCVALSPYSTQKNAPSCGATSGLLLLGAGS
jgi:hypothetical protein